VREERRGCSWVMIGVRGWMVEVRSSGFRIKDWKRAVGCS